MPCTQESSFVAEGVVLDKKTFLNQETWAAALIVGKHLSMRRSFLSCSKGLKILMWCNSCDACKEKKDGMAFQLIPSKLMKLPDNTPHWQSMVTPMPQKNGPHRHQLPNMLCLYHLIEISTFSLLLYWNLYFFLSIEISTLLFFWNLYFLLLFYWNLFFLFAFLLRSLLSLYFSIDMSTFSFSIFCIFLFTSLYISLYILFWSVFFYLIFLTPIIFLIPHPPIPSSHQQLFELIPSFKNTSSMPFAVHLSKAKRPPAGAFTSGD